KMAENEKKFELGKEILGELKNKVPGLVFVLPIANLLEPATGWQNLLFFNLVILLSYVVASTLDPLFDRFFRPSTVVGKPPAWLSRLEDAFEKWPVLQWCTGARKWRKLEDARDEVRKELGLAPSSAN